MRALHPQEQNGLVDQEDNNQVITGAWAAAAAPPFSSWDA